MTLCIITSKVVKNNDIKIYHVVVSISVVTSMLSNYFRFLVFKNTLLSFIFKLYSNRVLVFKLIIFTVGDLNEECFLEYSLPEFSLKVILLVYVWTEIYYLYFL